MQTTATLGLSPVKIILQLARGARRAAGLQWPEVKRLLRLTYVSWNRHRAPRLGAALAFYSILSITPLLLVALKVAALAYGEQAAQGVLAERLNDVFGYTTANFIQETVKSARQPSGNWLAGAAGLIAIVISATTIVSELRDSLNTIWDLAPAESPTVWASIKSICFERGFAFVLVIGTGLLLVASLLVNTWLAAAGRFFNSFLPVPEAALQATDALLSLTIIWLLFALIFKLLPDVPVQWSDVAVGSGFTALLFSIGKLILGLYLGKSSVGSAFGAAGSVVLLLVWVYYSAQIFFFGAEFTQVYANEYGSRPAKKYCRLDLPGKIEAEMK